MADSVVEAVQQAAENITENANVKVPASPEGMAIAYGSLVIMVIIFQRWLIFFISFILVLS